MNANKTILSVIAAAIFIGLLSKATFIVRENELAIKFQLGEFVKADYQPGLHFMVPFLHNVKKFDKRVLSLDATPVPYLTLEKKNVIVDSFIKWRIGDIETYYRTMRGQEFRASERLGKLVQEGLRNEFARRTIQEVISGDRAEIMRDMNTRLITQAKDFGIDVVDVRIKRIELPPEVSESVYKRMRAERERIAADWRSRGSEEAEKKRAAADRERTIILANATRDAQLLRGDGDASAADIYARVYGQNQEFYRFYRSIDSYRQVFNQQNDMLVLDANSDFFRFFKDQLGGAVKQP
ncbi:MAG: protease modulator HflC [Gammaproteobacteria bacterium]|nr:protease modulator HflC [Gammaproteobacteria bacterium]